MTRALGKVKGMPVVLEEALVAAGTPGKIRVYCGTKPSGGPGFAAVYQIGRQMLPVPGVSDTPGEALQEARSFLTRKGS
jgi:hypothetical protein